MRRLIAAVTLLAAVAHGQTVFVVTNDINDLNPQRDQLEMPVGSGRITATLLDGPTPIDLSQALSVNLRIINRADLWTSSVVRASVTNTDPAGVVRWVIPSLTASTNYWLRADVEFVSSTYPVFDRWLFVTSIPSADISATVTNNLTITNTAEVSASFDVVVTTDLQRVFWIDGDGDIAVADTARDFVPYTAGQGALGLIGKEWGEFNANTGRFDLLVANNLDVSEAITAADTGAVKLVGSTWQGPHTNHYDNLLNLGSSTNYQAENVRGTAFPALDAVNLTNVQWSSVVGAPSISGSGITNLNERVPGLLPTFPSPFSTAGWERVVFVATNPGATSASVYVDEIQDSYRYGFRYGYSAGAPNQVFFRRHYATPATMTVYRVGALANSGSLNFPSMAGMIGFQAAGGTSNGYVLGGVRQAAQQTYYGVDRWNSNGLYIADYVATSVGGAYSESNTRWQRVVDDGTLRWFQISANGVDWMTFTAHSRTDFITSTTFVWGVGFHTVSSSANTNRFWQADYYYVDVDEP